MIQLKPANIDLSKNGDHEMGGIFKENTSAKTCIGLSVLISSFAKMCFA